MKLFLKCDTGSSGHGTVGREFMKHLLKENIQLNVATHCWGFNLHGWRIGNPSQQFPDIRLREQLIHSKRLNSYYILKTKRDFKNRVHNVDELPHSTTTANSRDLIIKDFKGKEDINITIGGLQFAQKQPKNSYRITETTQNTTESPEKWKKYNNKTDEVWVPCEWAKQGILNVIDEEKIKIMPYGVDFHKPTYNDKIWKLNNPETFYFGTVSRWTNLKAHDILVKAFLNEFTEDDAVGLFIKTTVNYQAPLNAQMLQNIIQKWIAEEHILDPPEIGIMTDPLTIQEYWDLLNSLDCFVLPSRGEAIGISNIQAMSLGKPVISTDYSAIKEYLNEKTGFPLKIDGTTKIQQHCNQLYFYGGEYNGEWAIPSQQHLQEQMRKVYNMHRDQPEKLKQIGEKGKKKVREKYDWEQHIQKRIKRMEMILSKN